MHRNNFILLSKLCVSANTSAIWHHAAKVAHQLLHTSCSSTSIQKAYFWFFNFLLAYQPSSMSVYYNIVINSIFSCLKSVVMTSTCILSFCDQNSHQSSVMETAVTRVACVYWCARSVVFVYCLCVMWHILSFFFIPLSNVYCWAANRISCHNNYVTSWKAESKYSCLYLISNCFTF